jgi:hypothetical protein
VSTTTSPPCAYGIKHFSCQRRHLSLFQHWPCTNFNFDDPQGGIEALRTLMGDLPAAVVVIVQPKAQANRTRPTFSGGLARGCITRSESDTSPVATTDYKVKVLFVVQTKVPGVRTISGR